MRRRSRPRSYRRWSSRTHSSVAKRGGSEQKGTSIVIGLLILFVIWILT